MYVAKPSLSQNSVQSTHVTRLPHHWWANSWAPESSRFAAREDRPPVALRNQGEAAHLLADAISGQHLRIARVSVFHTGALFEKTKRVLRIAKDGLELLRGKSFAEIPQSEGARCLARLLEAAGGKSVDVARHRPILPPGEGGAPIGPVTPANQPAITDHRKTARNDDGQLQRRLLRRRIEANQPFAGGKHGHGA